MVPPTANALSPGLAAAPRPPRPPGYSPVLGGKRHPGARAARRRRRQGRAAAALSEAGDRSRGARRWRERRRGRGELRAGRAVGPELLRGARSLPITGSAKAALELLPLEGEGGEGEGRRHAAGREGRAEGGGERGEKGR